mmetsp:Transcript_54938/g.156372  ORF Transcript_54938/g.156372 Transcript_54938/m.156372 type:complete len:175 (-) Transcript_54938:17-541(-)
MPRVTIDLVEGITEASSRIGLKGLFSQFGEVAACWLPPLDKRGKEPAYVKFSRPDAAQAALQACNDSLIYLDGVRLNAAFRSMPTRTQDSREFDAKGSNLMTSRDLLGDPRGGDSRRQSRSRGRRRRSPSRSRSRSRSRKRRKSRSRDRRKQKSGSRSQKRKERDSSVISIDST